MTIDAKLIKACKKGNRKAQYQLYHSCYATLMGVCIRYKQDEGEAKAALNMGFLKILNNLDKYKTSVPFEAWIRRIMINTIIDEFRKNKKERELIAYNSFEKVEQYAHHVDYNEADKLFDAEEIELFIKELPPVSQKVFNLYVIDGYTHKEVAAMLDISVGTSKWHVSFARQQLKAKIYTALNTSKTMKG